MILHDIDEPSGLIEQIQEAIETLSQLRSASVERDRFVSHLSVAEGLPAGLRDSRNVGKQIERCVISTFQVAESMGFKGEFRQWEDC